MRIFLTIYLLLLFSWTFSQSDIKEYLGEVKDGEVWSPENNPYIIGGDIFVPEGAVFTIKPGTLIKFDGYFQILVKGTLIAKGTLKDKIVFTSNLEEPKAGDWSGIVYHGEQSKGSLVNCKISYAYKNLCYKSSPEINNNHYINNSNAIHCSYVKYIEISDNRIENNIYGIYCDFSSPTINNNIIINNEYGIYSIFSSTPTIGKNRVENNKEKDIHTDKSMEKMSVEDDRAMKLIKGLF